MRDPLLGGTAKTTSIVSLMAILDEADAFRHNWQARAVSLLSSVRFADAGMFDALPVERAPGMIAPGNVARGAWASRAVRDIARGLDHGYRMNTGWFDRALASDGFGRGVASLCAKAVEQSPASPLTLLFGWDDRIQNFNVTSLEDVAALARIAAAGVNPALLMNSRGKTDLKAVPPMTEMHTYAAVRLRERFPEHEAMLRLLECSDEEKYILFQALTAARLHESSDFAYLCAASGDRPLHRVLHAFVKTSSAEAALAAWDMPDEYLVSAFPAGGQ